jgi:hypothetical protein
MRILNQEWPQKTREDTKPGRKKQSESRELQEGVFFTFFVIPRSILNRFVL